MAQNGRLRFLDCTRALCMLYIIALWHMQEYLAGEINLVSPLTSAITLGVLGAFTFISAYFLGKRPVNTAGDALIFYKKRVLRLFPLFFISCTSMLLLHFLFHVNLINGVPQYILTLFGLSVIIPPSPQTVWYVSMIILFYLLTPLFNHLKTPAKKLICFAAVMALLIALKLVFGLVDSRVLINFPIYFAGLFLSDKISLTDKPDLRMWIAGAAVFAAGLFASLYINSIALDIVTAAGFIALSFEIGKLCVMPSFLLKLLNYISYGSMVAYLFHRQYLGVITRFTGKLPVWAAYLIVIPVLLVISYWVQLAYDKLLDRLLKR